MKCVLIVEDNGYHVCGISESGEDCIKKTIEFKPDIILMDVVLNGEINGIEAAKIILDRYYISLIFCSSSFTEDSIKKIENIPYKSIISKPFDENELISTLKRVQSYY